MARPRTALGTAGRITTTSQIQAADGRWIATPNGARPTRWRARTKHRDADGVLRDVERFASTKGRAETKLRNALRDRHTPVAGDLLRADMALVDAGSVWLEQMKRPDSGLSANSQTQYEGAYKRWVESSSIKGLTLREANRVPVLEGFLQGVADEHGTGAAKTARSVVSGILRLGVRYGVLEHNAMRDVRPAKARITRETQRDTTRALTRAQRDHLLSVVDEHERAKALDINDLVWFLGGTGARISEALAVRWDDVDLGAGTVLIRGTKSASSVRLLVLPEWLKVRLTDRSKVQPTEGLVFPSPGTSDLDKVRDRRNVSRVLRDVLDEAGFPWATAHTLRRTVATLIGEAGLPLVAAADQLGHANPAMTARVYLGRQAGNQAAAAVL
jgi:integrase